MDRHFDAGLNLPFKTYSKIGGVVVSSTKTLVKYGGEMYDVSKVENQVRNSNLSSTQKNAYLKDLDTVKKGYTFMAGFNIASACVGAFVTATMGPVGAMLFGLGYGVITGLFSNMMTNEYDKLLDLVNAGTSSQMNFLVDPSGYVYAAVTSNRIQNAKVTTYWIPYDDDDETFWDTPNEDKSELWNAEEYSQLNPLYTDSNGDYAWDVPEGWWKVVVEKEGYETYTSEWLPVPPPQTDVNINLLNKAIPKVTNAIVDDSTITLEFSEYMDPDTLIDIEVKDVNGDSLTYKLLFSTDESTYDGKVYAKKFDLILNDEYTTSVDYYTVNLEGAKSYSGVACDSSIVEIGEMDSLIGDVNGDGNIDITDATIVQKYAAEMVEFTDMQKKAADTNHDGNVDVTDATLIQKYVAEMIDQF